MAERIAQLLLDRLPEAGKSYQDEYDWENGSYFPEEINRIGAHRLEGIETFFNAPDSSFIPSLSSADLDRAIRPKEAEVAGYRKRCDQLWLVVVCDGPQLSTWFDIEAAGFEQPRVSAFGRILVMRMTGNDVHDLRLTRAMP